MGSEMCIRDRGAVDAERSRVHNSWKPVLNSFKKLCQPEHLSRSSTNVTNFEAKMQNAGILCFSV